MKRILSKRLSMALGGLVLVAGLAMIAIGMVTYLDEDRSSPGSNLPYRDLSLYGERSTDAPATPSPSPSPTAPPLTRDARYRMIIESIGVDAPVATYGLDPNGVPLIPVGDDAAEVVAWYDFSTVPGSGSNAVFSGHVTWYGQAVFYSLDQLKSGDTIKLRAEDGTELVYAVSDSFLVDPADPASLQVMQPTPTDTITLITCGGSWVPDPNDNVAGGDYTNRTIVQASLLSVVRAGDQQASTTGG